MSMYAVKNIDGEWLGWEIYQDDPKFICGGGSVWTDLDKAKFYAKANYGYVVELIEAPEKVVVRAEEAELLKQAKRNKYPATLISNRTNDEDRLMRAYVNGWTVEKPKQWNVKVPHADGYWFYLRENHKPAPVSDKLYARNFTDVEIDYYGLQDCEKVEVKE